MVATQIGGNKEEITHEELVRLYIKTPPDYSQEDIKDHFSKFGAVEYVTIIRDKTSNKSKGVAFVKFFRYISVRAGVMVCYSISICIYSTTPI